MAVRHDVRNGLVSAEAARVAYGWVEDEDAASVVPGPAS
jgi:hypothetical protein